MAPKKRTPDQIQQELAAEREGLSAAVDNLREEANVGRKLKAKLPVAAAARSARGSSSPAASARPCASCSVAAANR